jgi:hypothetical protein
VCALAFATFVACAPGRLGDRGVLRERYLSATLAELRRGRVDEAEEALARARSLEPEHPGVLMLEATLATMQWDDERALTALSTLRLAESEPYLSRSEVDGRIGDLLVRVGDHGRAELALRLSLESEDAARVANSPVSENTLARRSALAALSPLLPDRRVEPAVLSTEMPLVAEDVLPKLLCRFAIAEEVVEIPFVLDTGATFTIVQKSVADRLGVDTVEPSLTVTDGRGRPVVARFGVLPSMSLGVGVKIGPRPVLVSEEALLPDESAAALVGLDLLSRYRVTLDPERSTARFELPRGQTMRDAIHTVLCDGRVMVPVACESTQLWFVLDTGASRSSLTPDGLRSLPGGERRARNTLNTVSGPGGSSAVAREVGGLVLEVAGLRVAGASLPVVDRAHSPWFPIHGVLGSDILGECTITLDQGRLRLDSR